MAGSDNAESSFSINLASNAGEVSADAAAEMEQLRQKIHGSNDAVKQMSGALRSLRGSSDEVKAAKAQLKAQIDAERNAVSASSLALLKQGTTYEKLTSDAKKLASEKAALDAKMKSDAVSKAKEETSNLNGAISAAGGPVAELKSKFDGLKSILGGAGGEMALLVGAVTLAAAAIAALTVAAIGAAVSFVKFVVGAADAARSMNLIREASTGSAKNAHNLGTQVDALAGKVATSKEALNELAASLGRTRLSGRAIVDTFNLVGQASAAMGDEVGNQLKGIITRSQISQRIQINPMELQGTGLKFQDIAAQLAEQMHIGVKQAQQALVEGRVKLDDGARALRAAVEKRFGEINARKLLSLDVQVAKFKERLGALAADVNIEPLLKGFAELSSLFDSSTVSGATLKQLVTIIGNQIGPAFQAVLPIAKGFIKGLIIGALDVVIAFLKVKNAIKKTFGGGDALAGIDMMKVAVNGAKLAVYTLATGLAIAGAAVAAVVVTVMGVVKGFQMLWKGATSAWEKITTIDWNGLGASIVDGIVGGLKSGANLLVDGITGLADKAKNAFTSALGIHSPSKVFAKFGAHTAVGAAVGVRAATPHFTAAVGGLARGGASVGATLGARVAASASVGTAPTRAAAPLAGPGAARGGAGGAPISLHVEIHAGGGDAAKTLGAQPFLSQLTKAIEDALVGAGIPTQGVAA